MLPGDVVNGDPYTHRVIAILAAGGHFDGGEGGDDKGGPPMDETTLLESQIPMDTSMKTFD